LNANFLFDDRVRIVDWEYAGMSDPFFDLANVSVNNGFPVESESALCAPLRRGREANPSCRRWHLMKIDVRTSRSDVGRRQMA